MKFLLLLCLFTVISCTKEPQKQTEAPVPEPKFAMGEVVSFNLPFYRLVCESFGKIVGGYYYSSLNKYEYEVKTFSKTTDCPSYLSILEEKIKSLKEQK